MRLVGEAPAHYAFWTDIAVLHPSLQSSREMTGMGDASGLSQSTEATGASQVSGFGHRRARVWCGRRAGPRATCWPHGALLAALDKRAGSRATSPSTRASVSSTCRGSDATQRRRSAPSSGKDGSAQNSKRGPPAGGNRNRDASAWGRRSFGAGMPQRPGRIDLTRSRGNDGATDRGLTQPRSVNPS